MKPIATNEICVIDARVAGASGDKYLGALLDLGASEPRLQKVGRIVSECLPGTRKVGLKVTSVERGEIAGKLVQVESKEDVKKRKGGIVATAVQKCSDKLGLSKWAAGFAMSTINTLLAAESRVHGHTHADVELHELGSADTLVDVLGTAYLVEEIGLAGLDCWSTPLPTGIGTSHFSGRDYPNPPPAVAEIFRAHKIPISPSKIEHELTTPTGAAITANLATQFSNSYPAIRPDRIGYGAGSKEIEEVANILRIVTGERTEPRHLHDEVVVLEANLDDITGETVGHAMERVMEAGARDVMVAPVYMKKNRPGHLFSVIVDASRSEELAHLIMDETGSLGVREIPVRRHITGRVTEEREVEVAGATYGVTVKSALDREGRVLREKTEYEDRKLLSKKTGKSLREIDRLLSKRNSSREGS